MRFNYYSLMIILSLISCFLRFSHCPCLVFLLPSPSRSLSPSVCFFKTVFLIFNVLLLFHSFHFLSVSSENPYLQCCCMKFLIFPQSPTKEHCNVHGLIFTCELFKKSVAVSSSKNCRTELHATFKLQFYKSNPQPNIL